jgi:hypothetical protein
LNTGRLLQTNITDTSTSKKRHSQLRWQAEVSIYHTKGKGKDKGKAAPLQAWSGPEGSRKLRFPDLMTTAQDGGKVVFLTHRPPLPPGNTPGTHFC